MGKRDLKQIRSQWAKELHKSLGQLSRKGWDGKPVYLIVPFDHRLSDGLLEGVGSMEQIKSLVSQMRKAGGSALLCHVGAVHAINAMFNQKPPIARITHLNGETAQATKETLKDPFRKTLVTSVEEALLAGAQGVSVHINVSSRDEPEQFSDFMRIKEQRIRCFEKYGVVPALLMMAYPREGWKDEYALESIKGAAAAAGDMGADIIKTTYCPTDPKGYREVVQGATAPVVLAGGPKKRPDGTEVHPKDVLTWCQGARDAGARGISLGRNIFQQYPLDRGPGIMMKAINYIFVRGFGVEEAAEESGLNALLREQGMKI